ncbi:MAG TPA: aromatic-ring-hydroxylating dioxygenase subunit beta [Stellaceae bacterium]|jgi:3-phenylpropionate/cinnamic acid dioxygenase small subunit|nr:aromatic-ring-hydroxylating dioxygenase subunit beta [Stellaceae bacterium]
MAPEQAILRAELDALYADYAHCLDNDELEAWPEFFTEDCHYRITSAENFEAGMPIGIVYATSKAMLVDRVMALRKANIYEPQRYRHMIGAIQIGAAAEDGVVSVVANLLVVRTMQDGAMMLFAAGRYVDRLVRQGAAWRFARKDVVLDSRQIDTLLAIPL